MLPTTVPLPVSAFDCRCLHCQSPIESGLASGLCVECYLGAVYSADDWSLPLEDTCPFCCKPWSDCDCVEEADDDQPLGAPCPGDAFVPF